LVVEAAHWDDPTLVLRGPSWSFQTTSSWRVVTGAILHTGFEDEEAPEAIRHLVGRILIRCRPLLPPLPVDVRLEFDNEMALEVFTATAFEPWVFRLPAGPVLVASPSDPNWLNDQRPAAS
jgi:hypothetical protein